MGKMNQNWPTWRVRVSVTLVNRYQAIWTWPTVQAATLEGAAKNGMAWARAKLKLDKVPGRSQIDGIQIDVWQVKATVADQTGGR